MRGGGMEDFAMARRVKTLERIKAGTYFLTNSGMLYLYL
jgi:hypothetical protein